MVKMKIGQVARPAFTQTMQELLGKKLKATTAWRVKGLVNKFNEELKKFSELRVSILESHCKRDEAGSPILDEQNNYTFEQDAVPKVAKEIAELADVEVEVIPLKLSDLVDGQGNMVDMTAQQMFDLGDLLTE